MARVTRRMVGGGVRGVVVETILVLALIGLTLLISFIALKVL